MLRIIDARSGDEPKIGETIKYPDGSGFELLEVDDRFFTARARVRSFWPAHPDTGAELVSTTGWQPLTVRFTHPHFLFQRVAFTGT